MIKLDNNERLGRLAFSFEKYYSSRRMIFHIGFWLFLFLLYMIDWWSDNPSFTFGITFTIVAQEIAECIFTFYFLMYVAFPCFLKRKYIMGVIELFIPFLLTTTINYIVFIGLREIFLIDKKALEYIKYGLFESNVKYVLNFGKILHGIMPLMYRTMPVFVAKLLMNVIRYFRKNDQLQKREYQLGKENLQLEVNFLKSQMNPHFLFNTLNNIYAYVSLNDPKALDLISNLSEMLQYTLYGTKDSMVTVEKELGFLENYIELETVRYNEKNCNIVHNFDYSGATKLEIEPLLLFPFLENAFKHGIAKNKKTGWLKVSTHVDEDVLIFQVENNKPPFKDISTLEKLINKQEIGGIGVSSTQRRLAVLYDRKHQLIITEDEEQYTVLLQINCKRNEPEIEMYHR